MKIKGYKCYRNTNLTFGFVATFGVSLLSCAQCFYKVVDLANVVELGLVKLEGLDKVVEMLGMFVISGDTILSLSKLRNVNTLGLPSDS